MIKYEKYLGGASVEYSSQESIESDIKRVFSKLENVEWNKISDEEKIKKLSSGITNYGKLMSFEKEIQEQ